MSKRMKANSFFELPEDINAIPKGVYRLESADQYGASFRAGSKVMFSILGNWKEKVKHVPQSLAWKRKTKQSDFLDRYFQLLEGLRLHPKPIDPSEVMTVCLLDPSIEREQTSPLN